MSKTFSEDDYKALNRLIGNALTKTFVASDLLSGYDEKYRIEFGISQEAWEVLKNSDAKTLDELIQFIAERQNLSLDSLSD